MRAKIGREKVKKRRYNRDQKEDEDAQWMGMGREGEVWSEEDHSLEELKIENSNDGNTTRQIWYQVGVDVKVVLRQGAEKTRLRRMRRAGGKQDEGKEHLMGTEDG